MAAAPPGGNNGDIPAAAAGLHVYQRCFTRQLRVLDAKVARLELQLKDEMMEKISFCSELLDEIIVTMPHISSCSAALREELHKARAKRDKVYQHYLNQQQEIIQGSNSGGGGGAAPPAADAPPPADDAMSS